MFVLLIDMMSAIPIQQVYDHVSYLPSFGAGQDLIFNGNAFNCNPTSFARPPDGTALISGSCSRLEVYTLASLEQHCKTQAAAEAKALVAAAAAAAKHAEEEAKKNWLQKPFIDADFTKE